MHPLSLMLKKDKNKKQKNKTKTRTQKLNRQTKSNGKVENKKIQHKIR